MQETVLELKNYSVSFDTSDGEVQVIREKKWKSCAEVR